ncbi:N-acetyltransferase [Oceanobacillus piezotolerans]|uniref:N-acetyltransferase n=1 Tax=Oceanobacillus piezotolerans TaxID=2448030 RepID=A0A498DAY5_9BACI|nr:GNAT family N-acetyltransferase [Oceanobacillus piezotolerans]RLL48284.1 N-acetyltransferase [Oceanobacillus piezotolerans]
MEIKLSKFQEHDFDSYYSLVSSEKVMAQITERSLPYDEAQSKFQKVLKRNRENNEFGSYKVSDCYNTEFIGLGHLTLNKDQKHEAEIGYMILPQYWRMGYGKKIASELLKIANRSDIKILKAIIDPENKASRKILINQGFISEKICVLDGLQGEILSKSL